MIKNLKEWREPVAAFLSFLELSPVVGIKRNFIATIKKDSRAFNREEKWM